MRNKMQNDNIPFQIQTLIESLMNKNDSIHIRGNYRNRLVYIRDAINKSVKQFDDEQFLQSPRKKKA